MYESIYYGLLESAFFQMAGFAVGLLIIEQKDHWPPFILTFVCGYTL
jgi:hypothetical protein